MKSFCKYILFIVVLMLTFMVSSCIKSYYPEISNEDALKYVVTGGIIKGDTVQYINVSTTGTISKYYNFLPVTGCAVHINDDKNNTYNAIDMKNGKYKFYIPESALTVGSSFLADIFIPNEHISSPEPIHIVSDFDQLNECPDIDSIYYFLDTLPSGDHLTVIRGIRFCIDLDATNTNSRYFRFETTETWEYRATLASQSSPVKACWMEGKIGEVYTLSTKNLTQNKYSRYPFHFIDNFSSQRLGWEYSLLVRQYALSEAAFNYWEKIRINSIEQGGLYEKQPLIIKGNMHNVSNPDQQVLGFFGVSSVKSKRIFVKTVAGLPYLYTDCDTSGEPPPVPDKTCFNCLLSGGTNHKPAFWPY